MGGDRRSLIASVLQGKPVDRVPVGFWFHFVAGAAVFRGLEEPEIVRRTIEGHLRFYREFQPDLVKLMSDGYFRYPNAALAAARSAADLATIQPLGKDHRWMREQVNLARTLTKAFGAEVYTFYTIFSPATLLRFLFGDGAEGNRRLADLFCEDEGAVRHALDVMAEDLATLAALVVSEGGADGMYFSVQQIQDDRVDGEAYRRVVAPGEQRVIQATNDAGSSTMLHVCGYEGCRNDLALFADYPVHAVNWATTVEGVSLAEGKRLFGGRTVVGGFNNGPRGLLCAGTRQEIAAETQRLLAETGREGVILGADCTLPMDIDLEHLRWVRESAAGI